MFSHHSATAVTRFVSLQLAKGRTISASPGHYIWAGKAGQVLEYAAPIRAEDIQVGHWMIAADTTGAERSLVKAKTLTIQKGLYSPHSASGSIIVDGVAALTFTDTLPPSIWIHTVVTMPARLAYMGFKAVGCVGPVAALNKVFLSAYFSIPSFTLPALIPSK